MPLGVFIVPYTRITPAGPFLAARTVDLNITAPQLAGQWREVEVLGNRAIVLVNASNNVLTQLEAVYKRIPKTALNSSLSDLPPAAKAALRNEALDMGYTLAELNERFPNDLGTYTLADVLRFFAKRRRKPRYDAVKDEIVLDGDAVVCESIDSLFASVS